jgi:GNAT superfamily N-acetyltransferase
MIITTDFPSQHRQPDPTAPEPTSQDEELMTNAMDSLPTSWQVGDITIRPATLDDIPHIAKIVQAHDLHVRGTTTYDEAEALEELTEPNFVIEKAVRLAFAPDGTCVGIGMVYDQLIFVRPNLWGFVLPEYRNRGIGTALLGWQIDRAPAST